MDHQVRKHVKLISEEKEEWGSTFQLLSWWKKERIQQAKVMVVGSGALGNEVLKNLALLGIGHILVVDFDHIEFSNLSRSILFNESDSQTQRLKAEVATERIRQINPTVKTMYINGDITIDVGLGVYRRMDAIIGCLDNRLARLAINQHAFWMGKTWVDGAIENLSGQLNVYKPGTSCYESGLSSVDWSNIKQRIGCPDVAQRNATYGRTATTPITASIIAAMQVQEALKIVNGNEDKLFVGKTLYYEGMNNVIVEFETTPPQEEALSSNTYTPVVEATALRASSQIDQALEWLSEYFKTDEVVIKLHHSVVLEFVPKSEPDNHIETVVPFPKLTEDFAAQYITSVGDQLVITKQTSNIDEGFPNLTLSLSDLGVPALDILRVFANDAFHYVELTGDIDFLQFKQ